MIPSYNPKTSIVTLVISVSVCLFSLGGYTQTLSVHTDNDTRNVNNTGSEVRLAKNINPDAASTRLNVSINSSYQELKPRLTPDGNRLYFTRYNHPSNFNGVDDHEDIWYSDYDKEANEWSAATRLNGELNNAGPNYVNNVSATGDTLILGNQYGKKGKMRAGVSYTVNQQGKWSTPININIENDYNISDHSGAYVDLSSGVIIRAVKRCDSMGDRDLYVSFWDGETASEPINMGNVINTEFEESSPYLSPDKKTFYFASKGHHGHGGMDIFVTRRLDETWTNWSTPENLGPAVNGPLDDEFFSVTSCGGFAIFARQISIHNVDLFRISMDELFIDDTRDALKDSGKPLKKKANNSDQMSAFASL